jgi:hypothetical protein
MARRAFVALIGSAGVLAAVVGAGALFGAHEARRLAEISGQVPPSHLTEGWLLSPGAIVLLIASGLMLLKGRRS